MHSYAKVERLLAARQWNAAVHLLNRRGNFRDAPEHLQPLIREAYEFVCRQEAWAAFARIPGDASEAVDRQLVEAWNEVLFAGYPPAEQERPRVAEARRRVQVVDRLRHLAQQSTGPSTLADEQRLLEAAGQLAPGLSLQPARAGRAGREVRDGHGAAGSRDQRSDRRGGDRGRVAGGPGGPVASRWSARHGTAASPWPSSESPC